MRAAPEVAVQAVDVAVYRLPTDHPEADGTLQWDATTAVVVRARAGNCTGTGWTYADAAAAAVIRDLLAGVVAGRSARRPQEATHAMARAARNAGVRGLVAMAISADRAPEPGLRRHGR